MSHQKPPKLANLLDSVRDCIRLGKYRDTYHARLRQKERSITLLEILHVLNTGRHEKSKDTFDLAFTAWNYAIRGDTIDGKDVRVVVSFDEERDLLIITAISLKMRR